LHLSEGVVVKYKDAMDQWIEAKANDTLDVRVKRCLEDDVSTEEFSRMAEVS
jgi:hypothetical protein